MSEPFICKQCGAECGDAPGIGAVCTNPECDALDGCGLTKKEKEMRELEDQAPNFTPGTAGYFFSI